MTMTFSEANRSKSSIRIGIMGPTFSGKTYSAVLLARGLVGEKGRIAFVDCEGGEANLYANITKFDILTLEPPYTPEKFIEAIESAQASGYDAIILDTISHEWSGEGGILDDQAAIENKDSKRRWSCWGELTPRHNRFLNTMIRSPIHIITTMRMKMQYVVDTVDGRNTPRKIGLGPIQRDNVEYEISVLLEMDGSHTATIVKDKTQILGGLGDVFRPTIETGNALRVWIEEGIDVVKKQTPVEPVPTQTPKTIYDESQINGVKEDYAASGWSLSIFDQAKISDGLYDGDLIKADWKKRKEMDDAKPVPVKKPVVKRQETKPVIAVKKPEIKPEVKPAPVETKPEPKQEPKQGDDVIMCEECGVKITQMQKNMSILFCNGKSYCAECRKKYQAGEQMKTRGGE